MKLRVGIVNYLNSRVLAWSFLRGDHDELFASTCYPPSTVARLLAEGRLDVGLIPSIELQRIAGLEVIPDLCVAATQEVRSVLLVLARPPEDLRRVAVDVHSRTSVALLKILLVERYGVVPELIPRLPDLDEMLTDTDAALVIGDPALQVERRGYEIVDLAAEWRDLTGLPFVFAVWAVRKGVGMRDLAAYFRASLEAGRAALPELVAEAAAELSLPPSEVETYLTRNLSFSLQAQELAGLEEFFRRAHAVGEAPAPCPIEFCAVPETRATASRAK